MASLVVPDRITNAFVRAVALADDRKWFAAHPEATLRHRLYLDGEFGFSSEVRWWLAEAEEARQQLRDLRLVHVEVAVVLVVTRTAAGLRREFGFVAVTNRSFHRGVGLLPASAGGQRG